MSFESLMKIDRRLIFVLTAVVIALPLFVHVELPIGVQKPTQRLYDTIEAIDPAKKCLLVATDYVPQTEAENQPMTIALLRHGFSRRLPVLVAAMYVEGAGLAQAALEGTMAEFNARATSSADSIVYGRDVLFLGWQPPPIVPILGMGRSITDIYKVDWYGNDTASQPIMKNIRNYDDVGIVCSISGTSMPLSFVQFAQEKYRVKVGAGVTAVSAPDFYPYFETGQFSGMLGGMKGAAEYEHLVAEHYGVKGRQRAMEGMGSQSAAHILIIVFVVIGNIAYFVGRRKSA